MDKETRTMLAARYAVLSAEIEELQAMKDAVRDALLQEGPGGREAGALRVVVTASRKLDPAAFAAKYDAAEFPGYYEVKPRAAIAKALGDDAVYTAGPVSVRVMEAE